MAEVYLAQKLGDEGFAKWVAIKAILPHLANEERFIKMFLAEARIAARIDHPNVCSVTDFGQRDGTYYLAMEFLHGQPLAGVIRRARNFKGIPVKLTARIIAEAARGLHAAHEVRRDDGTLAEVVHRDVSPQNIFILYSGSTKVVDFGIARSNEAIAERTATGMLKGKVAYMAPEQIRGVALDRRVDVFALGIILWELLTGRRLFKRENDVGSGFAVLEAPIVAPSTVRPGMPVVFDHIVLRALARDRNQRYPHALDLARDLEAALANNGVVAGIEEVGELMAELFAGEIEERQEQLRMFANTPIEDTPLLAMPAVDVTTDPSAELSRAATKIPVPMGQSDLRPAPIVAPPTSSQQFFTERQPTQHENQAATDRRRGSLALLLLVPFVSIACAVIAVVLLLPYLRTIIERRVVEVQVREVRVYADAGISVTDARRVVIAHTVPVTAPTPPQPPTVTPPRPPAHPTFVRNGFLTLMATPQADVFEGSRRLGRTPLTDFQLRPGQHALRMVAGNGLPPQTVNIEIRPGGTTIRRIRWESNE